MGSKYDDLTRFIPAIQDEDFGKWIIDHENDGTPEHPKQFPLDQIVQDKIRINNQKYPVKKAYGNKTKYNKL